MTCWKLRCERKLTKSQCLRALKNLRDRLISRITAFKIIQLLLAGGGMGLHVCQSFYKNLADSSLVPGVLGGFIVVSAVLLIGHLFNFAASVRLNVTFSIVASLGYGWCMSSIMDAVRHEEDMIMWTNLLAKGIVCFAAIAIHLLEVLHAFITRDKRPWNLRSDEASRSISAASFSHPVQTSI